MQNFDLDDHLANFLVVVEQYNQSQRVKREVTILNEKLQDEVEVARKSVQGVTQLLQNSTAEDQHSVTTLYAALKEKYCELQKKYHELQKEAADSRESFALERHEIVQDHLAQLGNIESKLNAQKLEFSKKECDYYNEIQVQQASAALNFDEMESRLQALIRDTSQKLHESNYSCNTMRQELINYKTFATENIDSANKKIQELERKLRLTEQQLHLTQEKLFNTVENPNPNYQLYSNSNLNDMGAELTELQPVQTDSHSSAVQNNKPMNVIQNRIVVYSDNPAYPMNKTGTIKPNYVCTTTKYPSLKPHSYEEFHELPSDGLAVQSTANVSRNGKQCNNKFNLPALKQVSGSGKNQRQINKKRKLYHPDQLNYLSNMEPQE